MSKATELLWQIHGRAVFGYNTGKADVRLRNDEGQMIRSAGEAIDELNEKPATNPSLLAEVEAMYGPEHVTLHELLRMVRAHCFVKAQDIDGDTFAVAFADAMAKGNEQVPCVFVYKSPGCGYTGPLDNCDGSLEDCRRHGNAQRYGGCVGMRLGERLRRAGVL